MRRAIVALLLVAGVTGAPAQELELRAYTNTPIGVNFLLAGYIYTEGNVAFDPTLALTDARLRTSNFVLGLAHTLNASSLPCTCRWQPA